MSQLNTRASLGGAGHRMLGLVTSNFITSMNCNRKFAFETLDTTHHHPMDLSDHRGRKVPLWAISLEDHDQWEGQCLQLLLISIRQVTLSHVIVHMMVS